MAKQVPLERASQKMEADAKREDADATAKREAEKSELDAEPREAALSQVEHDTAEQQDRTHRLAVREQHEVTRTQSEKFIQTARELGLDEREETFDAALKKVARHKL